MTGRDIIYIQQDNMGPAAARNKGIEMATGKYLAFIDCDDLWAPNKLQLQMELMHKNASIDIVLGATLQTPITQKIDPENPASDQTGMFKMSLGAALFKKSVFAKVGALDNDLHFGEDLDWFFRARESRVFILIHKEIVQYYRQHAKMISNDNPTVNKNLLRIQKKSIVRRRKAGMKAILKFPKLDNFDEVMKFWQSKD
jgi:glycosyltransferase involved in cell wall biosynthesis